MNTYQFVLLSIFVFTLCFWCGYIVKQNEKGLIEQIRSTPNLTDTAVPTPGFNEDALQKISKDDPKWLQLYEREPKHRPNFTYLISEHSKCRDVMPFVVIFIASHPSEVQARLAIRASWASKKQWYGKSVLALFLIGNESREQTGKLYLEHEKYRDMIMQDFLDTHKNLTHKTRMAFQWLHDFCPKAQYIMKTDSDVFVNPGNLVNYLLNLKEESSQTLFTGYWLQGAPIRNKRLKYYVSSEEYPLDVFPPYCSGLGYVISGNLALRIYMMMCHVMPFTNEDAYVGVCLRLLGGQVHMPDDNLFFIQRIELEDKIQHLIAAHWVDPVAMKRHWETLQKT
ncbi:UDP-GalNAc:beta-1,3-N-acetylgalactosaminyltransferase 1-like [Acipenser ruthenus]|uniref:UDP-GalNAc:beta-1, 3-N-acetylgalactosaminyltransferase 1-like n=1 Tax=Acipenser ruthenus TaxID=7906 RepID=UPI00274294BA|nr:UDP-GalNAc:beta-1,3-N-acetylgalactosaminyltransferase 1-like [Acipenser ruthenus]XP_058890359.1 UDP-GalNAc:beta-1,3-N-acetylgalactosaminyltransferase 1-like [Acipenser ruthenus]